MNLLTLINQEGVLLSSAKRVFNASDTLALKNSVETANQLAQSLATSELQIEQSVLEGKERGYREGRESGLDDARNTLATQLVKLNERAEQLADEQRREAAQLALLIVRKITDKLAPEHTLAALATSAAKECIDDPTLILKVHPDRLEGVQARLDTLGLDAGNRQIFSKVVADASLSIDGCVVDSKLGAIVADLDTQLKALESNLAVEG